MKAPSVIFSFRLTIARKEKIAEGAIYVVINETNIRSQQSITKVLSTLTKICYVYQHTTTTHHALICRYFVAHI